MIGSMPALAQIARQQRGRGGAVDVVVAENGDAFAARHRVGNALRRLLHGGQHMRIGHRVLDGRIEKRVDRVGFDIAAGKDARQELGKLVALRNVERARGAALVEPVAPSPSGRRILDAKEKAILSHERNCTIVMLRAGGASSTRRRVGPNPDRREYGVTRLRG